MEEWHTILLNTNITYAGITYDLCIMLSTYAQIQHPNQNTTFFHPKRPNLTQLGPFDRVIVFFYSNAFHLLKPLQVRHQEVVKEA